MLHPNSLRIQNSLAIVANFACEKKTFEFDADRNVICLFSPSFRISDNQLQCQICLDEVI